MRPLEMLAFKGGGLASRGLFVPERASRGGFELIFAEAQRREDNRIADVTPMRNEKQARTEAALPNENPQPAEQPRNTRRNEETYPAEAEHAPKGEIQPPDEAAPAETAEGDVNRYAIPDEQIMAALTVTLQTPPEVLTVMLAQADLTPQDLTEPRNVVALLQQTYEAESPAALLPEYDTQLATLGAELIHYRARFCAALAEKSAERHLAISGGKEQLEALYRTVSTVSDPLAPKEQLFAELASHLLSHRQAEISSGSCLSGVHKDDLEIFINGYPARAFASQGQARSCALALKFAERELFYQDMGEFPLLLLDDVLSELDHDRQAFVTANLGGQTIITCCEIKEDFTPSRVIEI